jgi:hypothetical protein
MSEYTQGNKVPVKKYKNLKAGKTYLFSCARFEKLEEEKKYLVTFTDPEPGVLVRATTKLKEIIKDDQPTGKFDLRGDIVFLYWNFVTLSVF